MEVLSMVFKILLAVSGILLLVAVIYGMKKGYTAIRAKCGAYEIEACRESSHKQLHHL